FFGAPPLLQGEDPRAYDDLLLRVFGALSSRDVLEEIWVRDIVDYTWQALQFRRLKIILLTSKMKLAIVRLIREPLQDLLLKEFDPAELEEGLCPADYITPLYVAHEAEKLAQEWSSGDQAAIKRVEDLLASVGATMETVQAAALE